MKLSIIEKRLNEAMMRKEAAQREIWHLNGQINYHDQEASRIRQIRYKETAKKSRAETAMLKYAGMLALIARNEK